MDIEIRSASNGQIFRIRSSDEDGGEEVVYQVIEADEVEAFAEVLRFLLDHYGPMQSRYSAKRIHVVVEPGDKYDPSHHE